MTTFTGTIKASGTAIDASYYPADWTMVSVEYDLSGDSWSVAATAAVQSDATFSIDSPDTKNREVRLLACQPLGRPWESGLSVSAGDYVHKSTGLDGTVFRAGGAGTTGGSEPTWDATHGNTTSDNGIIWTAVEYLSMSDDQGPHIYLDYAAIALLLGAFSPAKLAYSVRKLYSYAKYAMRVRRASDDAEQDIGFVGNDLDSAALESFCSGTDGYIVKWYEQRESGINLAPPASSNQPQIVSAGSMITEGGMPAPTYNGNSHYMAFSGEPVGLITRTMSIVCKQESSASDKGIVGLQPADGGSDFDDTSSFVFSTQNSGLNRNFIIEGSSGYGLQKDGPGVVPHGHYFEAKAPGSGELFQDNVSVASDASFTEFDSENSTQFLVGARHNSSVTGFFNGVIQELIYWESDESGDRGAINSDVSTAFGTP